MSHSDEERRARKLKRDTKDKREHDGDFYDGPPHGRNDKPGKKLRPSGGADSKSKGKVGDDDEEDIDNDIDEESDEEDEV